MKTKNRYSRAWNYHGYKLEESKYSGEGLDKKVLSYEKKVKKALVENNHYHNSKELAKILKLGTSSKNLITKSICTKALGYLKTTGLVFLSSKQIWVLAFNLSK